ncbi:secretory protein, putative, partial [Perkinsus marinus ATCC 50983]
YAINKHNRRFRSWAQQRVRQYRLATAVTITTDPSLMDAAYLAAAVQKAASLRKHDVELWRGFTRRLLELLDEIPPEHIGYVLWGYGKSLYLPANAKEVYLALFDRARQLLPQLSSHAVMATLWAMKRVQIQPVVKPLCFGVLTIPRSIQHKSDLMEFAKHVMERRDSIRPTDFCKVLSNHYSTCGFRKQFSEVAQSKYDEELFAQGFRAVVSPTAIYTLWNDNMRAYILERYSKMAGGHFSCPGRFRRVQQTARPNHLHAAYRAAVICRVHHPSVWFNMSRPARQFYTRLSMRHIPLGNIKPGPMHRDVSKHLAELQVAHRNSFRWGPFTIDIGIEEKEIHDSEQFDDDRKKCIFIDGPTQFYFSTNEYLESVKMYHSTLSSLGWLVYRVHWMEWAQTYEEEGGGKEARLSILRKIMDSESAPDTLLDGESMEIGRKDLKRFK